MRQAVLTLLLLCSGAAVAGPSGTMLKDAPLLAKPFADAATVAPLRSGNSVEILGRQGGWMQVKSGVKTGWVRTIQVRTDASDGSGLKGAKQVATGRAGSGNIVATSGIRGLSEEELKGTRPNPAELKKLDGWVASDTIASQYATANKLQRRDVGYLPESKN